MLEHITRCDIRAVSLKEEACHLNLVAQNGMVVDARVMLLDADLTQRARVC